MTTAGTKGNRSKQGSKSEMLGSLQALTKARKTGFHLVLRDLRHILDTALYGPWPAVLPRLA